MKKTIVLSGIISLNLSVVGALMKVFHWPGANITIMAGLGLFALLLVPLSVIEACKDQSKNHYLLYATGAFCLIIMVISALFKITHLPGARNLMYVSIPLPFLVFLPLYLYYHARVKVISLTSFLAIMFLMLYLVVFNVLLAVKP